MRKWLTVILFLGANVSFGQLGISFHQSNLPFGSKLRNQRQMWLAQLSPKAIMSDIAPWLPKP